MAPSMTKNVFGVVCLMCIICAVVVLWTPHTSTSITTDTVVYSERYDANEQMASQTKDKSVSLLPLSIRPANRSKVSDEE